MKHKGITDELEWVLNIDIDDINKRVVSIDLITKDTESKEVLRTLITLDAAKAKVVGSDILEKALRLTRLSVSEEQYEHHHS